MSGYKYASCLGNFANVFTKSEMVAYTRYVLVPVDSLAERTELTPSRLFSSARRNCSREGSLSTITCRRIANHVAMQKSAAMEQATFTNHFCHCHQPKMSIIPYSY